MPVSAQILHPLTASSVTLEYSLKKPLKYIATRFSYPCDPASHSNAVSVSILVAVGVGYSSELWVPVIKHLYRLQARPGSPIHIRSVWVVDRPNHGDAAQLNEQTLKEHHSQSFDVAAYGAAIAAFIASGTLSKEERANLVALGHSGGTGSMVMSLPERTKIPYSSLILVEPPFVDPAAYPIFQELERRVRTFNSKRPTSWDSVDQAMRFMSTHPPWQTFDQENLRIICETFFCPVKGQEGRVTTKTPVEQQTASFVDIKGAFVASERLIKVLHDVPTHVINGARHDLWPKAMYDMISAKTDEYRSALASVTTIEGTGHYVPHEKPEEFADVVFAALGHGLKARL